MLRYSNICKQMDRYHLNASDLACFLQVDPATVENWISGKEVIPMSKLAAMGKLFKTSIDSLIKL